MSSRTVPDITLNDRVKIPQLGFGVFQVPEDETARTVSHALEAGYRSIDTAAAYGNEAGVGRAIAESGLPREDLFITTKLWNDDQGYDATLSAFDTSTGKLGLDYVDLYLIHWPTPARDRYLDTWRAFEKLQAEGRIRAIGVSNFQPAHLQRLLDESGTTPAVNQIELHPQLQQAELRAFHAQHGIATEAWSPLAQGGVLDHPTVTSLAEQRGKSAAQVILRWHLQLTNIVIPKSVTPERIRQNIDIFDFQLTEDDMNAISELDEGKRTGPDPDTFN
ncbi:aldo/keto reductase [Streptomyces sp. H10-C2]|uniref:aldo/keto reductase n=1 Tax=unclassified Streptomyces TaxID=2593676 RepID=UPI0024B9BBB4|nr:MULTISPECIES: aldo/keto reductase [unclassified Streptomyces]MDJ0346781.1 aldo/keto reductase [Streptomyces sp. PH10-H1]MDJ0374091.1 aldo/keto reductase [Streptomyces sp. H10-C2]